MEHHVHFAAIAPNFPRQRYSVNEDFSITPVKLPNIELPATPISSAEENELRSAIVQWWPFVSHEIDINISYDENEDYSNAGTGIGHIISSLLRIRTTSPFCIPLFSKYSWTGITSNEQLFFESIKLNPYEHITLSQYRTYHQSVSIPSKLDFEWIALNYNKVGELGKMKFGDRLSFALAAMSIYAFERTPTMAYLRLFTALECIINIHTNYDIAALVALYCCRPEERQGMFNKMKLLNTKRNNIVHNPHKIDHNIDDSIAELRDILAKCLTLIIDNNNLPNDEELASKFFQ